MEKKKLTLSISGSSKKTISSIEKAKTRSKNAVFIEKRTGPGRFKGKQSFNKSGHSSDRFNPKNNFANKKNFSKPFTSAPSDFERRKLAEQRATRRLKGEGTDKDLKVKNVTKRRELKLTISRALSEEEIGTRSRSLAS